MNVNAIRIITASDQETIRLGVRLAETLRRGDVVGLVGELGSGKTWFAKGLMRGLGVGRETIVTSPTFALVNDYQGFAGGNREEGFPIFHMDLYRLNSLAEMEEAGLSEYLNQEGIVIVEWAERWREVLPPETIMVYFSIRSEQQREIRIPCNHARHVIIMEKMMKEAEKEFQCL